MLIFFKKLKVNKLNRGMTYVELIVVLSIFGIMTSIVLANYGAFQDKVEIKNLSNDIALKIVEAQKSAMSGKQAPLFLSAPVAWKPSYGIRFDSSSGEKSSFIYFADLDFVNEKFDGNLSCVSGGGNKECISKIAITRGSFIESLSVVPAGETASTPVSELNIVYIRPDSGAKIKSELGEGYDHAIINIKSLKGSTAEIIVYASGRIQINQAN